MLIRIDHREDDTTIEQKLEVWNGSVWRNETINESTTWLLEDVDVSTHIKTQNEINNLTVRYLARATQDDRCANIDYIAVNVTWWK